MEERWDWRSESGVRWMEEGDEREGERMEEDEEAVMDVSHMARRNCTGSQSWGIS